LPAISNPTGTTRPGFTRFSTGGSESGGRKPAKSKRTWNDCDTCIPLWRNAALGFDLQLAPFFDYGRSWNTKRDEASPRSLMSVGIGLRTSFTRYLRGEIYWGHRLRHVDEPKHDDLQDEGVQFAIAVSL
jgi:hypothetical protein